MIPNQNQSANPITRSSISDQSDDAIHLQQWQLEIDNFIDETSAELGELAKLLEGGPILPETKPTLSKAQSSQPVKTPARKTGKTTASQIRQEPENADSANRLASLKQKFASRLEKNKGTE